MKARRSLLFAILTLFVLINCACQRSLTDAVASIKVKPSSEAPQSPAAQKAATPTAQLTPREKLIVAGIEQSNYTKSYDPAYVKLTYPGGDVPRETGVCADVIVRAFRACGIDLQKEIHEDMTRAFKVYPNNWGSRRADSNIDHRRVPNLMKWFERQNRSLPISDNAQNYLPGDVVAWDLGNGRLHIGLVTDIKARGGHYTMVHNIGAGAQVEDVLFDWKVIGHYRYFDESARVTTTPTPRSTPRPRSNSRTK
ncbi:MAG TPA: DUF1287 domain-containing protein [Blastocatellia bacterium]|nr:DUF1287 domain-containing protein [Blastocatellia bacterium]